MLHICDNSPSSVNIAVELAVLFKMAGKFGKTSFE